MKDSHNRYVETNLKPYERVLRQIKALDYSAAGTVEIEKRLAGLRTAAHIGPVEPDALKSRLDRLLPEIFAILCAVVRQEFGWTVFDSQLQIGRAHV